MGYMPNISYSIYNSSLSEGCFRISSVHRECKLFSLWEDMKSKASIFNLHYCWKTSGAILYLAPAPEMQCLEEQQERNHNDLCELTAAAASSAGEHNCRTATSTAGEKKSLYSTWLSFSASYNIFWYLFFADLPTAFFQNYIQKEKRGLWSQFTEITKCAFVHADH